MLKKRIFLNISMNILYSKSIEKKIQWTFKMNPLWKFYADWIFIRPMRNLHLSQVRINIADRPQIVCCQQSQITNWSFKMNHSLKSKETIKLFSNFYCTFDAEFQQCRQLKSNHNMYGSEDMVTTEFFQNESSMKIRRRLNIFPIDAESWSLLNTICLTHLTTLLTGTTKIAMPTWNEF